MDNDSNLYESCVWPQELSVERVATAELPTELGYFRIAAYKSKTSKEEFIALYKGNIRPHISTLARIHSQCLTGESFHSRRCDCSEQLRRAMELINDEGSGAIVYQLQEGRGIGILNKIRAYALQDQGADTVEANRRLGFGVDIREYRQCAEVLIDLGIRQTRLLSNNPFKVLASQEAGLCVLERVPIEVAPSKEALDYLRTKKYKLGHILTSIS